MDKSIYEHLLPLYYEGKINWIEEAKEHKFSSAEGMRSQFKRERKKRGDVPRLNPEKTEKEEKERISFTERDDSLHIICDSKRIITREDVIEFFNIDLNIWKIKEFTVKTSEGYRKDRTLDWHVSNGFVTQGDSVDSGKMLVVPMYHTETKFIRKSPDDLWTLKNIDKLFESIKSKNLLPKQIIPTKYLKNGKALLVPIADFHLGLLATPKTAGNEYNINIAEHLFLGTINSIKERVEGKNFEEVIFVIGNDFLNSDNLQNTTSHGTPQDNETFWYEVIDKAIELIIIGVNSLLEVSKVHVFNVVSNHDNHSMYAIMKVVEAAFAGNKNVIVDTSSLPRKYKKFGKTLIGLSHDMRIDRGLDLMTTEKKEDWSTSNYFYWILAHLHKAMQYEKKGLVEIYRVPTISGFSRWSNEQGYVNTEKKTQCFIIDSEFGFTDTMNIIVD